jgi:hypothetical protein
MSSSQQGGSCCQSIGEGAGCRSELRSARLSAWAGVGAVGGDRSDSLRRGARRRSAVEGRRCSGTMEFQMEKLK